MIRKITSHIVTEADKLIDISTNQSDSSTGGAPYRYQIKVGENGYTHQIEFQNRPIPEVGVNGLTQEALLAIVIDRLEQFQNGPFPCRENALALTKCQEALHWLQSRTRSRMQRGVEGTYTA